MGSMSSPGQNSDFHNHFCPCNAAPCHSEQFRQLMWLNILHQRAIQSVSGSFCNFFRGFWLYSFHWPLFL